MGFYAILCPRPSPAPEDSSCTVTQGYFSVVSRRFYPSEMYIMSQSLFSYLRIDTLSPSATTVLAGRGVFGGCVLLGAVWAAVSFSIWLDTVWVVDGCRFGRFSGNFSAFLFRLYARVMLCTS